jgi:hypothetical protein
MEVVGAQTGVSVLPGAAPTGWHFRKREALTTTLPVFQSAEYFDDGFQS